MDACGCTDGLVFRKDARGYRTTYRCSCPLGDKHAGAFYFPSDKAHEKPQQIAMAPTRKHASRGRDRAAGES